MQCSFCHGFEQSGSQFENCLNCNSNLCTSVVCTDMENYYDARSCGLTDGISAMTSWGEFCNKQFRFCTVKCSVAYDKSHDGETANWIKNVENAIQDF
jgi:hypothetical protein